WTVGVRSNLNRAHRGVGAATSGHRGSRIHPHSLQHRLKHSTRADILNGGDGRGAGLALIGGHVAITLPYRFDPSSVWRTIIKGAFGLNALLGLCILFALLVQHQWKTALGLLLMEMIVLGFTRMFIRFQEGSVGTLSSDRVVIEPNVLLGIPLPGPKGTYQLDRFSAVRVEFRSGPARPEL